MTTIIRAIVALGIIGLALFAGLLMAVSIGILAKGTDEPLAFLLTTIIAGFGFGGCLGGLRDWAIYCRNNRNAA